MRAVIFFLFLTTFYCSPLSAQITPAVAIAEMGRGINLGNTLEPPREGEWNNGPAQESYFDAYIEAGFTNVRIPVRWDRHTGNSAPFTINETWMNRVEQVVDWGLSRGLYITLNGHHEDWLKNGYSNATLRARYDAIWVQVAERFKNKSEKLLFEIINEPKGMTRTQVDDLNKRILEIIRTTNPTRLVIYGGNEWANAEQLLAAAIPDDDYLIGYYHYYDPWNFSGLGMGVWGTANDYQQMTNKYRSVKNWSSTNNIPIHHSEFGAVRTCDFNSRMRIYAHNVEQCLINGFAFSVWDDGGDFGVMNRGNTTWPELKDVLMHYHADSPNQIFSNSLIDPNLGQPIVEVTWNNRTIGNGNIILERLVGGTTIFAEVASLPYDATSYQDEDVEGGKSYTYRMWTTRADGTLLHGYPTSVTVIAGQQTPFSSLPIAIPGVLEVEEYDNGGEGLAYHDTEEANIPAGFRLDEGVDIGTYGNGYILEYVEANEWIEYTVNVTQSGVYKVDAEVASEQANGVFSITFDKNNASTSFNAPRTGGWQVFQEITANNELELEAGTQVMRLSISNDNPFNIDNLTFNLTTSSTVDNDASMAGFSIAPNPTNGLLNIDLLSNLQDREIQLVLYKSTGEKVATFEMNGKSMALDLSRFASGLYLLKLVGEDVNLTQRVVLY